MRAGRTPHGRPSAGLRLAGLLAVGMLSSRSAVALAETPPPENASEGEGAQVFMAQCASCHGAKGEGYTGPPVIGPEAALASYDNGQRLLEYIKTTMPQSNPGGLSDQQYRQVLGYLLVHNGFAKPGWSPEERPPGEISLRR